MDLKPVSKPQAAAPQAPMVTPTPAPQVDPFKPDNPTPVKTGSGKSPKSRRSLKIFMVVLLVLVLLGGVGYGTFYWQHQHVDRLIAQRGELQKQIADQQAHMTEMEAENAKITKEVAVTPTTDEQVITAVTNYCQAAVNPANSKEALVYMPSPAGNKKVLYSADKQFAQLTAACASKGTTSLDSSVQYYLKKSGSSWVVIAVGPEQVTTLTKRYNIPTKFE